MYMITMYMDNDRIGTRALRTQKHPPNHKNHLNVLRALALLCVVNGNRDFPSLYGSAVAP